MKIVSTSYNKVIDCSDPSSWLDRISFYTGILERLSSDHTVTSIDQINYTGKVAQNGVAYHFFRQRNRTARLPFCKHRFIRSLEPDIILINGLIYPLQVLQLRVFVGTRAKIIILHRAERPFFRWRKIAQQVADRAVDAYLFASADYGREWVRRGLISSEKKIFEVIQASSPFRLLDKSQARAILKIPASVVFLFVGRLNANKDPLTVVKAFVEFAGLQPNAVLYMIHQDNELLSQLRSFLGDTGASDHVRLVGAVERTRMELWYNSADFIISGSHYEGSGIAVSEAMSCGCIPIVTNILSFQKMTGNGKCGLLYEAGNVTELTEKLMLTRQMDKEGERDKVLRQFDSELSFEAIAGKINHIIKTI